MKTYTVYANQEVFMKKTVMANTHEEAIELAWEDDIGDWKEYEYGDFEIVDYQEHTNSQTTVTA